MCALKRKKGQIVHLIPAETVRFWTGANTEVLKRMFEAGTQPKREDLIGVVEGRHFALSGQVRKTFLVGKEGERIPDGGPLFADKKGLYVASYVNSDIPCNLTKKKDLDLVRFEGGSAITEWSESTPAVMKMRMNSGYLIIQVTYEGRDLVGYHFKKIQCDK